MATKSLELERLIFFSDAVVAIAITLLALDLRIEKTVSGHLYFSDLAATLHKFAAFFLSFIIIAAFWKVHHEFYSFIKQIDNALLWFNMGWLLFIVIIPFSSSLVSDYFFDKASNFIYAFNVLLITIFQNMIWDYVAGKPTYLKENIPPEVIRSYRIACNVAMGNAVVAVILSFISPIAAFIILFTRLPVILIANHVFGKPKRRWWRR